MPWTSYAKTFSQIIGATQRLCGDIRPTGHYGLVWTWAEVADAVNRAILTAVDLAGGLRAGAVIPLEEGVNVYNLPGDCLRLTRVNMHGLEGYVILPTTITEIDLIGGARAATGDPVQFFRELLRQDQIGVLPIPFQDGSTFSRDSDYGLLRGVSDEDGNRLPFDGTTGGLRRISGIPFQRTGDGRIIREVISPYGNLGISYIKSPRLMKLPADYPDEDIPEWFHKDIRYGAASQLLRYRRNKLDQARFKLCSGRWLRACMKFKTRIQQQGPMSQEATPC